MTSADIVFERRVEEEWEPVRSTELQKGDVTRMRLSVNGVLCEEEDALEQFRVSAIGGSDPDSHHRYDISLEPIEAMK